MLTYYPAIDGWFVAFRRNFLFQYLWCHMERFCQSCGKFLSNTYKPAKSRMDVDLRKFPLIPYNTTQDRIGGNFQKFLHFPFIPHTTEN